MRCESFFYCFQLLKENYFQSSQYKNVSRVVFVPLLPVRFPLFSLSRRSNLAAKTPTFRYRFTKNAQVFVGHLFKRNTDNVIARHVDKKCTFLWRPLRNHREMIKSNKENMGTGRWVFLCFPEIGRFRCSICCKMIRPHCPS